MRHKAKKAIGTFFVVLIVVILAAGTGAYCLYRYYYNMTHYEDPDKMTIDSTVENVTEIPTLPSEEESSIAVSMKEEIPSTEKKTTETKETSTEEMTEETTEETTEEETEGPLSAGIVLPETDSEVYNLLLVGVDRRDRSWNGNSDAMILMSINYTKQVITMTSIMRDTYVYIEGYGYRKLNAAFAYGGGPLLCQTIQENFLIPVHNYVWVDFEAMSCVVNTLGGIDLYLTVDEAAYAGVQIEEPQMVHLWGDNAVMHARDRFSGGFDYGRTIRQRNVMMEIINKAKNGSLGDLNNVANAVLPYVWHNMEGNTLLNLLTQLPALLDYPIQEIRIPIDGLFVSTNEFLVPSYYETIMQLFNTIY